MVTAHHRVLVALALTAAACSSGDGTDIGGPSSEDPSQVGADTTLPVSLPGEGVPTEVPVDEPRPSDVTGASGATAPATPGPTAAVSTFPEVPETGVPGLDSDDEFCAAWSRFGGSFQVVAVNAAFGEGSVADRAFVEVAAGPTVGVSIEDMAAAWPDDIESEADAAINQVYGPFAMRLGAAESALTSAGATEADITALSEAWLAFLAERDPTIPAVTLVLDDNVSSLVAAAVTTYLEQVGPWDEDQSLVTDVSIPLTEAYLAAECPDQGSLGGQEVG